MFPGYIKLPVKKRLYNCTQNTPLDTYITPPQFLANTFDFNTIPRKKNNKNKEQKKLNYIYIIDIYKILQISEYSHKLGTPNFFSIRKSVMRGITTTPYLPEEDFNFFFFFF
jgi:hypothetical protein